MRILKEKIKELASQQGSLKQQRKMNFSGVRTVSQSEAISKHLSSRDELRHLYMAYGLMRGRTEGQIERSSKSPISTIYVQKLITKYSEEAVCTNP